MTWFLTYIHDFSLPLKLGIFAGLAVAIHLTVIILRHVVGRVLSTHPGRRHQMLNAWEFLAI